MIHKTATVDKKAEIGRGVKIWHYTHVREDAYIGNGTSIGQCCYIDKQVWIGKRCKIQNSVNIYQGVTIWDEVFIGPGVTFTNDLHPKAVGDWEVVETVVEEGASIGANATILAGITIGAGAMVGAGAVVTHDVPPAVTVKGIPAVADVITHPRELIQTLRDYWQFRSRDYAAQKWQICDAVVKVLGSVEYDVFAELFDKTIGLLWQQQDNFEEDQKLIRERLIEPARKLFKPDPLPGGDNVAFLIRNCSLGIYAPYKHVRAFMDGMVSNGRKPFAYVYGPSVSSELHSLAEAGIPFRQARDVSEIRVWCEMDKIGTLIADSYASTVLALFEMRSAPVQMYLSPGFQQFPADVVLIPPTQNHWAPVTEAVHSPMRWSDLCREVEPLPRLGKVVFGVLGRYEKISPEYLEMVTEILDKVPGSVFVAYGKGEFIGKDERMIAGGVVDPHAALPSIDVYLDTYPLCGGISVWEAMAHRVPVVTRSSPDVECWNMFKPYVVNDKKAYVKTAISFVEKPMTDTGYYIARNFSDVDSAGKRLIEVIDGWQSRLTQNSKQPLQTGQSEPI